MTTDTMLRLLYFTPSEVRLEQITDIAERIGYACRYDFWGAGKHLTLLPDGPSGKVRWVWRAWGPEHWHELEPGQRQILLAYQPAVSFQILCEPQSLSLLSWFLRQVLESYGGWVICGQDWSRIYEARSIENLRCRGSE